MSGSSPIGNTSISIFRQRLLICLKSANGLPGANAISTDHLRELAAQFRGQLLEDLATSDQQEFQNWLLTEREAAKRPRASLLHVLVERLRSQASGDAVQYARDLVEADPYSVAAHAAHSSPDRRGPPAGGRMAARNQQPHTMGIANPHSAMVRKIRSADAGSMIARFHGL